jgi:hypothetical protein
VGEFGLVAAVRLAIHSLFMFRLRPTDCNLLIGSPPILYIYIVVHACAPVHFVIAQISRALWLSLRDIRLGAEKKNSKRNRPRDLNP